MKLKSLQPEPLVFYRHHLRIVDAVVLTHLGRCGLQGASRVSTEEATGIHYSTVATSFRRLQDAGLIAEYSKANSRGRTMRFVISHKGWELMTTPPELELFPDAVAPLKLTDR